MKHNSSRQEHRRHVPITFKGDWTEEEKNAVHQALQAGEAHIQATLRRRIKGRWLAKATLDSEAGKYFAVHRLGIGMAFTGHAADDIAEQIESRWPASALIGH